MAGSTLAVSPQSETPRPTPEGDADSNFYEGSLIDGIIGVVEKARRPKPPQPVETPAVIPTDDERRERNAAMLLNLWEIGERMTFQAFELRHKPDPLLVAYNGFPDVSVPAGAMTTKGGL